MSMFRRTALSVGVAFAASTMCTYGVALNSVFAGQQGGTQMTSVTLAGIPRGKAMVVPKISGDTIRIPVGNGQWINWKKGQQMHIAYLTIGSTNNYLVEENNAVKKEAAKLGATVTMYDGNFNAQTQIDQLQTVLSSHKYNVIICNPVDPRLEYKLLAQTAPAENILVSVIVGPLGTRASADGDNTWTPGTLNFVGGDAQPHELKSYFSEIMKQNPGQHNVALITGPQDNGPSINAVDALKAVIKNRPDVKLVATYYTDYSSQAAYKDTQTLLQAHPNTDIIIDTYVEMTIGTVAALKQSGKLNQVKVYDKGGATWDKTAIKSGIVKMDMPQYPVSNGRTAVDAVYLATHGYAVPRYLSNDGASTQGQPLYVTPQNVDKFKPEYEA
ncbi:MAG: sugar ABC transporter substrate-binding protein [Alicyclobacillus sp.]|nr:sugar ABC transporter substrate-binding protein [Alicyclobacillus sp.]